MDNLKETVKTTTTTLDGVIEAFKCTLGGKYGAYNSPEAQTMIRAILTDIENLNKNLKNANESD
jgi:hypothetical protein